MKKKHSNNFLCICKHLESQHVINDPFTSDGCSGICEFFKDGTIEWCQCKFFRLNNLEYLEQKYEENLKK